VQVLEIAGQLKLLKLGTIALDGTKVHANASPHSAPSYRRAGELQEQLKREVQELLRRAEQADSAEARQPLNIPAELARREARLAAIAQAKAEIERRAAERHAAEQAAHEAKSPRAKRRRRRRASAPEAGHRPHPRAAPDRPIR
jgi:hypothetical protein